MYKNRHMKDKWQHMTFKPDPISKIPHRQHTHLTLSFHVMKKNPNNSYLMYYYKMKCMGFFLFREKYRMSSANGVQKGLCVWRAHH